MLHTNWRISWPGRGGGGMWTNSFSYIFLFSCGTMKSLNSFSLMQKISTWKSKLDRMAIGFVYCTMESGSLSTVVRIFNSKCRIRSAMKTGTVFWTFLSHICPLVCFNDFVFFFFNLTLQRTNRFLQLYINFSSCLKDKVKLVSVAKSLKINFARMLL